MSTCQEFKGRRAEHPIDALFLRRWSPRAMSGDAVAARELFTILEAARWAPSARNAQPWRFLYALRGDTWWTIFLTLLTVSRRTWLANAGALVIILASTESEYADRPPTYSFAAGAACQNACLQATSLGLASHVVEIRDVNLVRQTLEVPDEYAIQVGLVLGHPGQRSELPAELQDKEAPRLRRPLSEIAFKGAFSRRASERVNEKRDADAIPASRASATLPVG